jgi:uncharacterized protein YfdQ (DUF2303 family)
MTTETPATVQALRDLIEAHFRPDQGAVLRPADNALPFLLHPTGQTLTKFTRSDFEAMADAPFSRRGKAVLQTVESFIAHVKRFADPDSAIFANFDRQAPSLLAVLDYHRAGAEAAPRWGHHRAEFGFPLSDQWKAWTGRDRKAMSMIEFALFLEDRVLDVMDIALDDPALNDDQRLYLKATGGSLAGKGTLLAISTSLKVNESSQVKEARNLTSGETQIQFADEHQTEVRGDIVKLPSAFVIAIPVFKGSPDFFRILARFRYRKTSEGLRFWFELWNADATFDVAFREACQAVEQQTGLPVMFGKPEA